MWALCRHRFAYSMLRVSLKSLAGMVAFYNMYYDLMKMVYNSPQRNFGNESFDTFVDKNTDAFKQQAEACANTFWDQQFIETLLHYTSSEYGEMDPQIRVLLCVYAQFVIIISGDSQEDIHQKYLMHNFR